MSEAKAAQKQTLIIIRNKKNVLTRVKCVRMKSRKIPENFKK